MLVNASLQSTEKHIPSHPAAMMHFSRWLLLSLAGMVTSSPQSTHEVHEKRNAVPMAWTKHSRALGNEVLPVRIGLKQRNLEHSDRFLEDISDPDSPNFGRQYILCQHRQCINDNFRKTLDCGDGCQHLCTTPRNIRGNSRLAHSIWDQP